jgi:hypothetical protein
MRFSLPSGLTEWLPVAFYGALTLLTLGSLIIGIKQGTFTLGLLGWRRAERRKAPVKFTVFALAYLSLFLFCLINFIGALRETS